MRLGRFGVKKDRANGEETAVQVHDGGAVDARETREDGGIQGCRGQAAQHIHQLRAARATAAVGTERTVELIGGRHELRQARGWIAQDDEERSLA